MAKNVNDMTYKKIDVDALDPDQYKDVAEPDDPSFGSGQGPDEAAVKQFLQSNKTLEALKAALQNPPLKSEDQVGHF